MLHNLFSDTVAELISSVGPSGAGMLPCGEEVLPSEVEMLSPDSDDIPECFSKSSLDSSGKLE